MKHFYNKITSENWFDYASLYERVVKSSDKNSHFVEVGTWKGMSAVFMAVEIINSGKEIKFDCVDTWDITPSQSDIPDRKYKNLFNVFQKNIETVKHIINPVKSISWDAAKLYNDESLDFVFIDAGHDYVSVTKDLTAWWPKVKKGGIIAGHDYNNKFKVKEAVHDFFKITNAQSKTLSCWEVTK